MGLLYLLPLYLGKHSELDAHFHIKVFLTLTDNITSQNIDLSSRITLYVLA